MLTSNDDKCELQFNKALRGSRGNRHVVNWSRVGSVESYAFLMCADNDSFFVAEARSLERQKCWGERRYSCRVRISVRTNWKTLDVRLALRVTSILCQLD